MKKIGLYLILFLFILCTACSNGSTEKNTSANASNKEEDQSDAADNEYSLENDGIDEEAFSEDISQFPDTVPEHIVTTSVPITEMLYLLDITPSGVPTSTNPIPEAFNDIEQLGSPMEPDLEVLTDLEPDLIIGAKSLEESLEDSLGGIDLDRAYLKTDSFEDLKQTFKVLGTYFDKTEEMNTVLTDILEMENDLMKQASGKELPSVLLMIGTSESFMVMSEDSYLGSLVERLGAENIATTILDAKDTYSPMNMEEIVAADPDIVLVLASGDHGASEDMYEEELKKNDIWKSLSAYQNDDIHILDYDIFGVTSILNVEQAMTEIADYFFE
ncbi:MAG TPA: ABC transporter substrate-binding protein [Candidatus Dormibacteraeota bacterium]|nr:ABC transporter substrate-binding protein [Candidatus Dormibacteraeota bacterium]